MAYQPTGRPPGRPRKVTVDVEKPEEKPSDVDNPDVVRIPGTTGPAAPVEKPLKRAHKGYRRAMPSPAEELHRPPRFSKERRHLGARPILHPNVIKGA